MRKKNEMVIEFEHITFSSRSNFPEYDVKANFSKGYNSQIHFIYRYYKIIMEHF